MRKFKKIILIVFISLIVIIGSIGFLVGILMSPLTPAFFELIGIYPGDGFACAYFNHFEGTEPSFFPDGNRIVFASPRSGRGDIYITDTTGSILIRLTKNRWYEGYPSISPDGT
ncbi:MAG: hypothetical protein QME64_09230, partial [bacterium]|nr:hypothetical protein [bacterium]